MSLVGVSLLVLALGRSQQSLADTGIDYYDLPKENAIVFRKGNGQRELAVFSDPFCPACRRLESNLGQLENVTIYLYLFPLRRYGNNRVTAVAIWCSSNPKQAWRDLLLRNKKPNLVFCNNPVDDNSEIGRELGVRATPTMIRADGKVLVGAHTAGTINKWLGPVEQENEEQTVEARVQSTDESINIILKRSS